MRQMRGNGYYSCLRKGTKRSAIIQIDKTKVTRGDLDLGEIDNMFFLNKR